MNEVTVTENKTEIVMMDFANKAKEYLNAMGTKLPNKHMTQFVELAEALQLNPFKREIYAVGYGENWNIITGFEVYLKRAERTGLLDGWETEESGNVQDGSLKSTITIYRKDRSHPFKHTVYYCEAVNKTKDGKPNSVWAKMPIYMTKKVAMAQGFRLCFPDELGGMPYTGDEMPEIEQPINVTPKAENPAKVLAEEFKGEVVLSEEEKKAMVAAIAEIMKKEDIEGHPLFSEEEKKEMKALIRKSVIEAYDKTKAMLKDKEEEF